MLEYDRNAWFTHIFSWKGSVFPAIVPRIAFVTSIAAAVFVWHEYIPFSAMDKSPHGLVGVAMGLLLVFRTNSAYDRFWEGRKRWGMIANRTRDLTRQSLAWIRDCDAEKERIAHYLIAFTYSTREHLRGTRDFDELKDLLSSDDLEERLRAYSDNAHSLCICAPPKALCPAVSHYPPLSFCPHGLVHGAVRRGGGLCAIGY